MIKNILMLPIESGEAMVTLRWAEASWHLIRYIRYQLINVCKLQAAIRLFGVLWSFYLYLGSYDPV